MYKNKKDNIVAIIEARMGSTRLPNKVLMEASGIPMLKILINRLKKSNYLDDIVVATTINKLDDSIESFCNNNDIKYFRGSEDNVLERVCKTAQYFSVDTIVEITGDCPLVDPDLVDQTIDVFYDSYPKHKYISNSGYNMSIPAGLDVQVFKSNDLYNINNNNPDLLDKEHVSYRFYRNDIESIYNPKFINYNGVLNRPEIYITLDYLEDYILIKNIYESLSKENYIFSAKDIIEWLDKNPELRDSVKKIRN